MPTPLPGVLLMTGAAMLAYGFVTGRLKLRDAKGAFGLLAGMAGFVIAGRTLPGPLGLGVGATLLLPSVGYFVYHTRRVLAESKARLTERDRALIEQAREGDPALALMAEASIHDAQERRSQALWRKMRVGLALPVTMATAGLIRGDLRLALFGAAIGLIPPVGAMLVSRFSAPIAEKKKLKGAV